MRRSGCARLPTGGPLTLRIRPAAQATASTPAMTDFKSPLSRALTEYWFSLPRPDGSMLPLKNRLEPMAIPKLLPRLVLHDLRQPGESIMRVVGTGIAAQYGFDPTGHDYIRYVASERRQSALAELHKMAAHPCGMTVLIEHIPASGSSIFAEATGYPFATDDGVGRFVLFVDDALDRPQHRDPRRAPFRRLAVHERTYIDIGAGVPAAGD